MLATIPHSEPKNSDGQKLANFTRVNGDYRLILQGDPNLGIPYGVLPRLILVWLISEAVRTQNKEIFLGHSLSEFMREIGIEPISGRKGNLKLIRDQMARLFGCRVTCSGYKTGKNHSNENLVSFYQVAPVYKALLWWHPKTNLLEQPNLFNSSVILSEDFFQESIATPVPLDMRALKALKSSSMALDIYSWLTYSMFSLQSEITVSWEKLYQQFGADYKRLVDFRLKFKKQLVDVLLVYNKAKVVPNEEGLKLFPSPTHVKFTLKHETKILSTKKDN